ncbi:MAG: hypothetical protein WBD55_01935 [Dehalococcoidia bacterium]
MNTTDGVRKGARKSRLPVTALVILAGIALFTTGFRCTFAREGFSATKTWVLATCRDTTDKSTCRIFPITWTASFHQGEHGHWQNSNLSDLNYHVHNDERAVIFLNIRDLNPPFGVDVAALKTRVDKRNSNGSFTQVAEWPGGVHICAHPDYRVHCASWDGTLALGRYGGQGELSAGIFAYTTGQGPVIDPDIFLSDPINTGAGINHANWTIP